MRILVTGSRDWTDATTIRDALHEYAIDGIVVHGDCPTGADAIAHQWALEYATPEPHPANWKAYGKLAGPLRNTEMAQLGADLCLAFLKNQSKGTRDMINKAIAANIRTVIYPVD